MVQNIWFQCMEDIRRLLGSVWLLPAIMFLCLPSVLVAGDPWVRKVNVTPPGSTSGAAVIDDRIYLIGGIGYGYQASMDNRLFDPVSNTWEVRKEMPQSRAFLSTVVVDRIIYAIGGSTAGPSPTAFATVFAYDPASNSWTSKKDLPRPAYACYAGVVDGIIYAFGGLFSKDSLLCESFAYNPATDEWSPRTARPLSGGCAVIVYDGLIYTFGGVDSSQSFSRRVYVYDPKTDTWLRKTDMPSTRIGMRSSLVGGKIYLIGGYQTENSGLTTVEVYDPINDTWEVKGNMPEATAMHAQVAVEGKIYVMGGTSDWVTGGQSNWEYNPSVEGPLGQVWTVKEKLPFGRVGGGTSLFNNKIYMMGGITWGAPSYPNTNANQVYDPVRNTWQPKKDMPTARAFHATAVLNNEIYAMGGGYPTSTDTVEAYDPVTDTWSTRACLPKSSANPAAAVVDSMIYLISGNPSDSTWYAYDAYTNNWTAKQSRPIEGPCAVVAYRGLIYTFGSKRAADGAILPSVYVYDPKADQWTKKTDMPTPRLGMRPYVLGGKIFVLGGFQIENTGLRTIEVYDPRTDRWVRSGSGLPENSCFVRGETIDGTIYVMAGTSDWSFGGEVNWQYNPALDIFTGIDRHGMNLPTAFVLEQNFPNPFNPTTKIAYSLPKASHVVLAVYNTLGQKVAELVNADKEVGYYDVYFDASHLASGAYVYRLRAGSFVQTKKLLLLK